MSERTVGLTIWNRYTRKLGPAGTSDDYDTDSGVSHAVARGYHRTLCGVTPGREEDGWFFRHSNWEPRRDEISCKRCLRALDMVSR